MTMLDLHAQAANGPSPVYHEFLMRYRPKTETVYGFVEGKEDPSFYRGSIESSLPVDWKVEMWAVGNKNRVLSLLSGFDWEVHDPARILFFVDRDLSVFFPEETPATTSNLYVTDNYSVENDIVSRTTCDRILSEVCGLETQSKNERDQILDLFEAGLGDFQDALVPVMVWIIIWRRNGHKPCLDHICMDDLFAFQAGKAVVKPNPKRRQDWYTYLHGQCNIPEVEGDYPSVEDEFRRGDGVRRFIRGKYEMWFLACFCLSVYRDIATLSTEFSEPPKMRTSMGKGDAMVVASPRARAPQSLRDFLQRTCVAYAARHAAAS